MGEAKKTNAERLELQNLVTDMLEVNLGATKEKAEEIGRLIILLVLNEVERLLKKTKGESDEGSEG